MIGEADVKPTARIVGGAVGPCGDEDGTIVIYPNGPREIVEPELFARFGSSEAVNAALRAIVEAAEAVKYPAKAKRSPRGSRRTAASS